MKLLGTVSLSLALALALLSCARPPEPPPPPPPPPGVENAELDLSLASVPESLTVAANQGRSLQLEPVDPTVGGAIWFEVGPEEVGVNLVAAVRDHQQYIEGLPDGNYMGAQELQADFGTAFYSRGRFTEDGAALEETVIFRIHPRASRLLSIDYRYPAGDDSAERVEQLIDLLGYVE
jgi:hypothetical protein